MAADPENAAVVHQARADLAQSVAAAVARTIDFAGARREAISGTSRLVLVEPGAAGPSGDPMGDWFRGRYGLGGKFLNIFAVTPVIF